ncbi:hypothetical protein NK8_78980 (plasmid) [Caballeronia sp. NK8]|nr:hypothetical protein NK8_78980 [Caballeronia sp. NK8]
MTIDELADVNAQRIVFGHVETADDLRIGVKDFCHVAFLAKESASHYAQRARARSNIDLRFAIQPVRSHLLMKNQPYEASGGALP